MIRSGLMRFFDFRRWPQRAQVALLLTIFSAMALIGLQHKGYTYDEQDHLRYGVNILHGDADRFDDSKMPVSAWNALPWLVAEWLPEGRLGEALSGLFAARVPTVLAALLLGLLIYRWARELYGNKAGLLALGLFTIDANLLAHARWATTDLYAALGTTLALYCFWRFLRGGGLRKGIWSAFALAFAQICKYTAVFLVPLFAILVVVRHWRALAAAEKSLRQRLQWKAMPGYAALFLVMALLVINASFLFRQSFTPLGEYQFRSAQFQSLQQKLPAALPVPVPYPYLQGLDWVLERERAGSVFGNLYMLGELRGERGFKGYYFVAYLFKVPLPIQILFIAAAVFYWRRRRLFHFSRDEAFLLLPVLFFFIYFNFLYESHIGIRFLIVAFPLMHIFSASLMAPQAAPTQRRRNTIVALLVAGLVSVLSWHPHYLSYFNELVPDRKMAYRILADSNIDWGENQYYLDRWLERHPEAIVQPDGPVSGTIVVGVNDYSGVFNTGRYAWLREGLDARPVDHVAYSWLVFNVTPDMLQSLPQHWWPQIPSAEYGTDDPAAAEN
jgi:4-amino-4-deoxy-L-arabinose transferase-like glycosyltransferase